MLVLADLGRIDIDVDDLCMGGKGLDLAGNPVIEASPDRDHEIAFRNSEICIFRTMHPQHAEIERVVAGNAPDAHQGGGNRNRCKRGKFHQFR